MVFKVVVRGVVEGLHGLIVVSDFHGNSFEACSTRITNVGCVATVPYNAQGQWATLRGKTCCFNTSPYHNWWNDFHS